MTPDLVKRLKERATEIRRIHGTISMPFATVEDARLIDEAAQSLEQSTDTIERMREALTKCRDKFCEYERSHAAKARAVDETGHDPIGQADERDSRLEKAERNREMAELCDQALSLTTNGEKSS